jgi:diguanylate cyclase (GGDEF)-like protein
MSNSFENVEQECSVHTLATAQIVGLLESHLESQSTSNRAEPQLEQVFRSILMVANEYVPSLSGSICLAYQGSDTPKDLIYIASFGPNAELIPGTRLATSKGITGRVFRSGRSCVRNDVKKDRSFYVGIDEKTRSETQSLLCVPISLDDTVVGVLSLLNRQDPRGFRKRDLKLMEIFCRYLSTSIQNLVDFHQQRQLALRDHLSGLHNDRSFYIQLLREIEGCDRYGGDLSLVFLDLDHFKAVVDTHGHLVGSQVLAEVGALLRATVSRVGATLARYGGDEYVVILPGCSEVEAIEIGEQIRQRIAAHTYLTKPKSQGIPALHLHKKFTASIGVACYRKVCFSDQHPESKRTQLIRHADEAMYKAKSLGKNQVIAASQE